MDQRKLGELKKDSKILSYLAQNFQGEFKIELVQTALGLNFNSDILPVLKKYDLFVDILNDRKFRCKEEVKQISRQVERDIEEAKKILSEKKWYKNPYFSGIMIAIFSGVVLLFLQKYYFLPPTTIPNNTSIQTNYNNTFIINVNNTFVNTTTVNNTIFNHTTIVNPYSANQAQNVSAWKFLYFNPNITQLQTTNMLIPDGNYLVFNINDYAKYFGACDCSEIPVTHCVLNSMLVSSHEAGSNYTTIVLTWADIDKVCKYGYTQLQTLNST